MHLYIIYSYNKEVGQSTLFHIFIYLYSLDKQKTNINQITCSEFDWIHWYTLKT